MDARTSLLASFNVAAPDSQINDDTTLAELGLDSLDKIMLIHDIESEFNINIPALDRAMLTGDGKTFKDLLTYLTK